MRKKYTTPEAEVIKLNYTNCLLSGSLLDVNGEVDIMDDGDIVDVDGTLDPESREYDFDMEDDLYI